MQSPHVLTAALIFWKKRRFCEKRKIITVYSSIVGVIYQRKFPSLHIHQCTYNLMNTKLSFPFDADDKEKKKKQNYCIFFSILIYTSVVNGERRQACKMPEALGTRLNEPRRYAINSKKYICNIILYYINLKYISFQLRLDQ